MTSFMGFTQVVLALLKIFSYTAIQIVRTIFGGILPDDYLRSVMSYFNTCFQ